MKGKRDREKENEIKLETRIKIVRKKGNKEERNEWTEERKQKRGCIVKRKFFGRHCSLVKVAFFHVLETFSKILITWKLSLPSKTSCLHFIWRMSPSL